MTFICFLALRLAVDGSLSAWAYRDLDPGDFFTAIIKAFLRAGEDEAFFTIGADFFFALFKASMTSRRDSLFPFLAVADVRWSSLPLEVLREACCFDILLFWRNRLDTAVAFFTVGAARCLELLYLRDTEERRCFLLLSVERLALLSLAFFSLTLA